MDIPSYLEKKFPVNASYKAVLMDKVAGTTLRIIRPTLVTSYVK